MTDEGDASCEGHVLDAVYKEVQCAYAEVLTLETDCTDPWQTWDGRYWFDCTGKLRCKVIGDSLVEGRLWRSECSGSCGGDCSGSVSLPEQTCLLGHPTVPLTGGRCEIESSYVWFGWAVKEISPGHSACIHMVLEATARATVETYLGPQTLIADATDTHHLDETVCRAV